MKPPSILDPAFKYVPAHETDIRKTFARVRKEIEAAKAKDATVLPLRIGTAKEGKK